MQQAVLILPVVLPIFFWAAYHYHKDRHLPEPPLNLLLCFCLGLLSAGLARLSYVGLEPFGLRYDAVALGIDNPWGLLAYATLVIGPVEEFAKLLPFLLIVIHFKAFDEPLDGIIYASFIGLGYAAAENVYYLEYLSPIESIARGFAGPVVHIVFASILGALDHEGSSVKAFDRTAIDLWLSDRRTVARLVRFSRVVAARICSANCRDIDNCDLAMAFDSDATSASCGGKKLFITLAHHEIAALRPQ